MVLFTYLFKIYLINSLICTNMPSAFQIYTGWDDKNRADEITHLSQIVRLNSKTEYTKKIDYFFLFYFT